MNKEELLKALEELPKVETNNAVGSMDSINIDDLMSAVDRFNKVPDYNDLLKENQELKKQLEECKHKGLYNTCLPYSTGYKKAIKDKENQQKEFIEYMNKTMEELECDNVDDEEMKGYLIQRVDTFREILSKYKKIIGVSDDNKTTI